MKGSFILHIFKCITSQELHIPNCYLDFELISHNSVIFNIKDSETYIYLCIILVCKQFVILFSSFTL